MSEPVSALQGERFSGLLRIRDAGPQGMVTLRGDLSASALRTACTRISGTGFPKPTRIEMHEGRALAWMSPDELFLMLPRAEAPEAVARLGEALAGTHHLAADVSDARAMFHIEGAGLRQVLGKLTPADLRPGHFAPGTMRRSRLAQVPAAFWMTGEATASVICFRSVARYVFDLLSSAAAPGAAVDPR
jgi:sarcosine oxidase subunit gamma